MAGEKQIATVKNITEPRPTRFVFARLTGEAQDQQAGHGAQQVTRSRQELFETQVERTPNAVALVYNKGEVSYRELDNQANRVAHHLRSLGVGPDVPVGICVQRSTDMVVGLPGILKPAAPTCRLIRRRGLTLVQLRVLSFNAVEMAKNN